MNYVAHQCLKGNSGQTTIFKWFSTGAGEDFANRCWCRFAIRTPQIMDLKSIYTNQKQYLPTYSLCQFTKTLLIRKSRLQICSLLGADYKSALASPFFG